jgi:hypothetical protein
MGTGSFPGVKRPGRGPGHPSPSSAEVKRVSSFTSTLSGLSSLLGVPLLLPLTKFMCLLNPQKEHGVHCTFFRAATDVSGKLMGPFEWTHCEVFQITVWKHRNCEIMHTKSKQTVKSCNLRKSSFVAKTSSTGPSLIIATQKVISDVQCPPLVSRHLLTTWQPTTRARGTLDSH